MPVDYGDGRFGHGNAPGLGKENGVGSGAGGVGTVTGTGYGCGSGGGYGSVTGTGYGYGTGSDSDFEVVLDYTCETVTAATIRLLTEHAWQ